MNAARRRRTPHPAPVHDLDALRARLEESEGTLRAIRAGEVDAVVVTGKNGARVFTLEGADQAYRVLMEAMNEGALTLTADKQILYANQRFARMVKRPLDEIIGGSFRRFLSAGDRATLRALLKRVGKAGAKFQALLNAGDGSNLPVQISVRRVSARGSGQATVSMVVTDMTDARRNEDTLRALTHRLVQAQEAERGRVALELHDHITQLLCATLLSSQALANKLATTDGPSKLEAARLSEMLGKAADEVERISRNLRPSILDELGLLAVLRATTREFTERSGVPVALTRVRMATRLPADTELTVYRILQEALSNVEKHALARHVTVNLRQRDGFALLSIHDDGIGFDAGPKPAARKRTAGLGLLSMRERANYVGGTIEINSTRRTGTRIEVRVPLSHPKTALPV